MILPDFYGPNHPYILAFLLTQLTPSVSYIFSLTCVCAQLLQSCLTLWDHMGSPGPSVHGILQARVLEWAACSPPGDLLHPAIKPMSPALQAESLPLSHQAGPYFPPHIYFQFRHQSFNSLYWMEKPPTRLNSTLSILAHTKWSWRNRYTHTHTHNQCFLNSVYTYNHNSKF